MKRIWRDRSSGATAAEPDCWWPETEAPHRPTSEVIAGLLRDVPSGTLTLGWLIEGLRERSFGIILVVLAVIGMLPGVGTVTGLLMLVPATQMILARSQPVLPKWLAARRLPAKRAARLLRIASRQLGRLEAVAYPRWSMPRELSTRVIGGVVLLLALSLLSPLPFSQIIPNLVIILIAFSFLEKDGLLLTIGLLLAPVSLAISGATIWAMVLAAGLL